MCALTIRRLTNLILFVYLISPTFFEIFEKTKTKKNNLFLKKVSEGLVVAKTS